MRFFYLSKKQYSDKIYRNIMKRRILYIFTLLLCVGVADAAVRGQNSITRNKAQSDIRSNTSIARSASSRTNTVTSRTDKNNAVSSRTARSTNQPASDNKQNQTKLISRTKTMTNYNAVKKPVVARSAVIDTTSNMGTGYTSCREAYFTCMDQFCGTLDDTYRRCICSSKLNEIQSRERALAQTASQLEDFKSLNLEVVDKTAQEVNAMVSASEGEIAQAAAKDKSTSTKTLNGISDVLSNTKKQSLSTQGTLDIAGDISSIWNTSSLAGGTIIANLTGEALYNAVHAQCVEMVKEECSNTATRTMVVSAYGMYIENDCSLLVNTLDKQQTLANTSVRDTKFELGDKRLENYNYHNSSSINDCIAQVRKDITENHACGADYVHCLDVTGLYLNYETGEPIYSSRFFELNDMTSMDGDLLINQANRMTILRLREMRDFAKRGLDTCRDISNDVWDEFLRQAITEIHQGQQDKIRQVKDECMDVVNKCYDEQNKSLKDFSNTDEALLLGSRLELSETMCQEKLSACSNVYGGLNALVQTMHKIVDQQIAQECQTILEKHLTELCAVPSNDTEHSYPYGCRTYSPGNESDAMGNKPTTSSIYYKLIEYAKQTCVRPSESGDIPSPVRQDISTVMNQFKIDMANELAKECERQTGIWNIYPFSNSKKEEKLISSDFYSKTAASDQWGWCADLEKIWKSDCPYPLEEKCPEWVTVNANFYAKHPEAESSQTFCCIYLGNTLQEKCEKLGHTWDSSQECDDNCESDYIEWLKTDAILKKVEDNLDSLKRIGLCK